MSKIVLLGTALFVSAVSTSAIAGPKWNQISISYLSSSAGDDEISGFGMSGSKLLGANFFAVGSYATFSEDIVGTTVDADLNYLSLGLGVRKAVAGNTDLFGIVSYENVEAALSSGFTSQSLADVDGYAVRAGVRSMIAPKFELSASASYAEYDEVTESGFDIGAAYYFTNQFSLGAGYGTVEDVDTLSLTGTFSF